MGRSGYTSLSIEEKVYAKMRRLWDNNLLNETDLSFTQWHTKVVMNSIDKAKFLKDKFPHLKVIKVIDKGLIIEDSKKNEFVKVILKGTKLDSNKEGDEYLLFAALHPELKL